MSRADRFLNACRGLPTDTTPVWLMRQAGRYMAAYRAVRAHHGILEMIKTPALATDVTLQPVRAFELDAAIIFADILTPLEGMGLRLEFVAGEGPVIHNPVRTPADVTALATPPAGEALGFTLAAIREVRAELAGLVPLIGFAAAPFTLACYAIEGGSARDFTRTKGLLHGDPATWDRLMDKLATLTSEYLIAQAAAGAQVLQLFDSWAGVLSPTDYRARVLPVNQRVVATVRAACPGVPLIYFSTGTGAYLDLCQQVGADVLSVDWRVDLPTVRRALGPQLPLQGNLDPLVLLAPPAELTRQVRQVVRSMAGQPGYIFNLGHGVLKETPESHVAALVEAVHAG